MATCRGIDLSTYQSAQNRNARTADGVVSAFAKAGEGEHTHDAYFTQHITGIVDAGLVPGAYHFGRPYPGRRGGGGQPHRCRETPRRARLRALARPGTPVRRRGGRVPGPT
jgi:GH25 family lysozyme M1 (1,4-beta-N-acetylmuramidase)